MDIGSIFALFVFILLFSLAGVIAFIGGMGIGNKTADKIDDIRYERSIKKERNNK